MRLTNYELATLRGYDEKELGKGAAEVHRTIVATALAICSAVSWAQGFPSQPVKIIVPYGMGGTTDLVARSIAPSLSRALGVSVIVDNRPGAGGRLGTQEVAEASPNGYVLLVHHIGISTAPFIYRSGSPDPTRDLAPVSPLTETPMVIMARPSLTVSAASLFKSGRDLRAAMAGTGSMSHLCALALKAASQDRITITPYRGSTPAMTDLSLGEVDIFCDGLNGSNAREIRDRKVRGVMTLTPRRSRLLPELPTAGEASMPLSISLWTGLFAPRNTPNQVRKTIESAVQIALEDAETVRKLAAYGISPTPSDQRSSVGLSSLLQREMTRWQPLIANAGSFPIDGVSFASPNQGSDTTPSSRSSTAHVPPRAVRNSRDDEVSQLEASYRRLCMSAVVTDPEVCTEAKEALRRVGRLR